MTDTLRADCEKLAYELYAVSALHTYTDRLVIFARAQQAKGIRIAVAKLDSYDADITRTDVYGVKLDEELFIQWCEAQATALEIDATKKGSSPS